MPIKTNPSSSFNSILTVPVIAGFDTDGHIIPLLVKLENERYDILSYYLKRSTATKREFIIYVVINNIKISMSLTYFVPEEVWGIPQEI